MCSGDEVYVVEGVSFVCVIEHHFIQSFTAAITHDKMKPTVVSMLHIHQSWFKYLLLKKMLECKSIVSLCAQEQGSDVVFKI